MARKKIKKFLKKALPLAALGLGAAALAKRKRHLGVRDQDNAALGVNWYNHRMDDLPLADHTTVRPDRVFSGGAGFKKGGHVKSMGKAKRGGGVAKR